MKKRIYLPIEIQNREFDVRLDLAAKMLAKDWEVILGRFNDVVNLAHQLGGGVLFYKAHSDSVIEKKLMPAKKAGTRLVCLDEEGLIFPSSQWYLRHRIGTGEFLDQIDAIFTWGPLQHNILASTFPQISTKLHMTGNARIHPSPRSKDRKRDVILINTNFGPANLSKTIRETYIEMVEKQRTETGLEDRRFLESRQEYYGALIEHYVAFIRDLATQNIQRGKPFKIVLRPHPIEDMLFWEDAMFDLDVKVETKRPTTAFFPSCHCMIHTGCTTAIEGFMAGVPVLRYNPIYPQNNTQESIIPNAISQDITNASQVFDISPKKRDVAESLSDYIFFGENSPSNIQADIIDNLDVTMGKPVPNMGSVDAFSDHLDVLQSKCIATYPQMAKRFLESKTFAKRRAQLHRWPLLAKRDLKSRSPRPVTVKKVKPQVFLLQN